MGSPSETFHLSFKNEKLLLWKKRLKIKCILVYGESTTELNLQQVKLSEKNLAKLALCTIYTLKYNLWLYMSYLFKIHN